MTDTNTLIKHITENDIVTLAIIDNKSIDIENIITDDGPNAHVDFALYLIQVQYRKILRSMTTSNITRNMKQRALFQAMHRTFDWLLHDGRGLIDRTTGFMFAEAERSGWFRNDIVGWGELEDMVASTVDATEDDSSEHWAWLTFAKQIVPAAKAAGIETGLLLTSSTQVRKLRHHLVPAWNELSTRMHLGVITPEEGEKDLRWMLEMSANPGVTSSEMKEQVDTWRGIQAHVPDPLVGLTVMVSDNDTIYIQVTRNRTEAHMIENALRNKVNFDVVGLKTFITLVTKLIGLERMSRVYEETLRDNGNSGGNE